MCKLYLYSIWNKFCKYKNKVSKKKENAVKT